MFQCRPAEAKQTPSSRRESRKRVMDDPSPYSGQPALVSPRRFTGLRVLGCGLIVLLILAIGAASAAGSPIPAGAPELSDIPAVVFLAALACAFVLYVLALLVCSAAEAASPACAR
jgi:hypothetical protein